MKNVTLPTLILGLCLSLSAQAESLEEFKKQVSLKANQAFNQIDVSIHPPDPKVAKKFKKIKNSRDYNVCMAGKYLSYCDKVVKKIKKANKKIQADNKKHKKGHNKKIYDSLVSLSLFGTENYRIGSKRYNLIQKVFSGLISAWAKMLKTEKKEVKDYEKLMITLCESKDKREFTRCYINSQISRYRMENFLLTGYLEDTFYKEAKKALALIPAYTE